MLAIGNCIASSHFQRSRARAGTGVFGTASYQFRTGDQEGYGASYYERNGTSDHEKTSTGERERKESRAEDQKGDCASDHEKTGASVRDGKEK